MMPGAPTDTHVQQSQQPSNAKQNTRRSWAMPGAPTDTLVQQSQPPSNPKQTKHALLKQSTHRSWMIPATEARSQEPRAGRLITSPPSTLQRQHALELSASLGERVVSSSW